MAPQDMFKQTYVAKMASKDVPNKVNVAQHCPDHVLLKPADVGFGYQKQGRWT